MKSISWNGIGIIKRHEGLRLKAYLCPANVWTIGYGHTGDVKPDQIITQSQADDLLVQDLMRFNKGVNELVKKEITQNQFDSLVSFSFNVGLGALGKSTLLKKVNRNPKDETIRDEFHKWVNAGGKRLAGLVKRREEEANLYFTT